MRFDLYNDVHEFYNLTYDVLLKDESQNMIMLGNIIMGHQGEDKTGWTDPVNWLMATVSDQIGIKIVALMTPPHNIALYCTDNVINDDALQCLCSGLCDFDIPGVISEKEFALAFAKSYTKIKALTYDITANQRIYELIDVNLDIEHIGTIRLLNEKDIYYFAYWVEAFYANNTYGNTVMNIPSDIDRYKYTLSSKKLYVLEVDGIPVSMCGLTRKMKTAIGVAHVYTPPFFRNRGYATSCVAKVSQIALDQGFTRCVLYTDLLNPTSNSIYQKIGYKPICDSLMIKFS